MNESLLSLNCSLNNNNNNNILYLPSTNKYYFYFVDEKTNCSFSFKNILLKLFIFNLYI